MPPSQGVSPLLWAHFRFSVLGPLLCAPPQRGALKASLEALAEKSFTHPVSGEPVKYSAVALERWYYRALHSRGDPVQALRRRSRKDFQQQKSLSQAVRSEILSLYKAYPEWTARLLFDNLLARAKEVPTLPRVPSYSTVRRFLRANGLERKRVPRRGDRPGLLRAAERLESREVRSFEAERPNSLWHLDFHVGSRKVLTPSGAWVTPFLIAILDDFSRLICHAQWYLAETAESLVHALSQALQKRQLPRALLSDNGAAMIAEEVERGLLRLSVVHDRTLPYSAYQNGKQEVFWAVVEGRLLPMLRDVESLTLPFLNESTQAWLEIEHNRTVHSETKERPIDRFLKTPDVSRPSPSSEVLRNAFRRDVPRKQRRSDGTITLEGVRFEIPGRFRHLRRLVVRYAFWDLQNVHVVDERTDALLAPIYPLDKTKNADGNRRALEPSILSSVRKPEVKGNGIAPLLRQILSEYAATGLPPAYLPTASERRVEA